jgi:hypothetical protein
MKYIQVILETMLMRWDHHKLVAKKRSVLHMWFEATDVLAIELLENNNKVT